MKKKLIVVLIMLTFTFIACAGPQRISIRQCKEVAAMTVECMSTEIVGDFSMLPF